MTAKVQARMKKPSRIAAVRMRLSRASLACAVPASSSVTSSREVPKSRLAVVKAW
jgi:hypothetical protein